MDDTRPRRGPQRSFREALVQFESDNQFFVRPTKEITTGKDNIIEGNTYIFNLPGYRGEAGKVIKLSGKYFSWMFFHILNTCITCCSFSLIVTAYAKLMQNGSQRHINRWLGFCKLKKKVVHANPK